jgi:hypothetical protein
MDPLLIVEDFTEFADANFRARYYNPDGSINKIAHEELNWFAKQIALRMGEAKDAAALAQSVAAALNASWAVLPARYQSLAATIYVNASTGNDSTGTGTSGSPVASLGRAAQLVNNLYADATIEVQTNLTLTNSITFAVKRLVIRHVGVNITFPKLTLGSSGEGSMFVANTAGDIVFVGADTTGGTKGQLIVTAGTGWSGTALSTWQAGNGAVRAGSALAPKATVKFIRCDLQVGANTVLVANGTAGATRDTLYETRMDAVECALTMGTGAMLGNWLAGGWMRTAIQLDATWKTLLRGDAQMLQPGAYAVRIRLSTENNGGATFDTIYSGVLSWYAQLVNDSVAETNAVTLQRMGLDPNGVTLSLRTRLDLASTNTPWGLAQLLQISSSETLTSAATIDVWFNKIA